MKNWRIGNWKTVEWKIEEWRIGYEKRRLRERQLVVSCSACVRLPAKNSLSLVNEVDFLEFISKNW